MPLSPQNNDPDPLGALVQSGPIIDLRWHSSNGQASPSGIYNPPHDAMSTARFTGIWGFTIVPRLTLFQ